MQCYLEINAKVCATVDETNRNTVELADHSRRLDFVGKQLGRLSHLERLRETGAPAEVVRRASELSRIGPVV